MPSPFLHVSTQCLCLYVTTPYSLETFVSMSMLLVQKSFEFRFVPPSNGMIAKGINITKKDILYNWNNEESMTKLATEAVYIKQCVIFIV
jgi:hypothetical protein